MGDVVGAVPGPGQPLGDGLAVVASRVEESLPTLRSELDECAPGVGGVGPLGHPAALLELPDGAGDRGLRGPVGVGQGRHAERSALLEQGQDPDARGIADAPAYGADQAGGLHHELAALLLEVTGHPGSLAGQDVGMPTYIAFLRAINIGKRTFTRDAIVAACEGAGCTDVETYINTGNVRVTTPLRSRAKVEAALEAAFENAAGFDVPTIVLTPKELREVAAYAERAGLTHDGRHYVSLLKDAPSATAVRKLEGAGNDGERALVDGRGVHLLLGQDYHSAKLSNAVVEKHLGVATNRNLNVIRTLAEKWG